MNTAIIGMLVNALYNVANRIFIGNGVVREGSQRLPSVFGMSNFILAEGNPQIAMVTMLIGVSGAWLQKNR